MNAQLRSGPYTLGLFGHARCCDCARCARARVKILAQRWKHPASPTPASPDATIYVRAHFRRGKYLTRTPRTLRLLKRTMRREFSL